ncbi:hypothetical protein HDU89_000706 [Geranomyces variabilis]|nr:hypothetical protein HDU89_000706 [Geranomyces variabilis]
MLSYDALAAYAKYTEGYLVSSSASGVYDVKVMPLSMYQESNKQLVHIADILLDIAWCTKSSGYFIMFAIFGEITEGLLHQTIIPMREAKIILAHTLLSVGLFITMPNVFRHDLLLITIAPQFVYHAECAILILLSVINIRRFKSHSKDIMNPGSRQLLWYYVDMTRLFAILAFCDAMPLFIINVDLLSHRNVARNKFITDMLTKVFNWGSVLTYPVAIMILYPKSTTFSVPPKHKVSLTDIIRSRTLYPAMSPLPNVMEMEDA